MNRDPKIDTQLKVALKVMTEIDNLGEDANRTHGSIGVINGVLSIFSQSEQLTEEQRTQIGALQNAWHSVLYPNLAKKPIA